MYYFYPHKTGKQLWQKVVEKMRKYEIQSSIFTMMKMERFKLITKEKVKEGPKGKLKLVNSANYYQQSINDDLERFCINLQNQQIKKFEFVDSYFTPILASKELKLVEKRNEDHLMTYWYHYEGYNPDVDIKEMKRSNSKSKYVLAHCSRWTVSLNIEDFKEDY